MTRHPAAPPAFVAAVAALFALVMPARPVAAQAAPPVFDPTDPAKRPHMREVNVPLTEDTQARLDELAAAVKADPANVLKRADYGWALTRVGKTQEGLAELQRAAAEAPNEPKVQLALARGLWKANRVDASLAAALKVTTSPLATPHDASEAYRVAGSCAIERPETRMDAEGYFRKGIEREPKNAALRLSYAALLLPQKRHREAYQELESAIRYATETRVLRQTAELASHSGRPELSREAWVRIAELRPDDPDVLFVTGAKEFEFGNNEAAVAHLTRAVQLKPDDGNAHLLLSQALLRLGRIEEAQKEAEVASRHGADAAALLVEIQNERINTK